MTPRYALELVIVHLEQAIAAAKAINMDAHFISELDHALTTARENAQ